MTAPDGPVRIAPTMTDAPAAAPTLYLIDGHSQVFKAYHAIRQLSTSRGVPVNAVFGFLQVLHRLLKTRKPGHLAVVFDTHHPTFRHAMSDAYKANRAAPPEDLAAQVEIIDRVLAALRIPTLRKPGFEADDILATLARQAAAKGYDVFVVTADKDLFQLVDERTKVLRLEPDNETVFDRDAVKAKMGVWPEQVGDYLAITGDASDNVPGIKGIGAKGAAMLLERFGTLEAVLAGAGELKGKQAEYVRDGAESARLSRRLVALDEAVELELCCDDLERREPDIATLAPIYQELEFRRFLDDLTGGTPRPKATPAAGTVAGTDPDGDAPADGDDAAAATQPLPTDGYRAMTDEGDLAAFCARIGTAGLVALDTETDSLSGVSAGLVGISLSVEPGEAIYIPVAHTDELGAPVAGQLPLETVRRVLGPVLADPAVVKIGHNLKFDWKVLRRHGLDLDRAGFDTLLASYLLNPDRRAHGLKELAADLLGVRMTRITDLIGTGKKAIAFGLVPLSEATPYAAADADVTLRLYHHLSPRLDDADQPAAAPPKAISPKAPSPTAPECGGDLFDTPVPPPPPKPITPPAPDTDAACRTRRLYEGIELPLIPVLMTMELEGIALDRAKFADLARDFDGRLATLRAAVHAAAGREFNLGSPKQVAEILFTDLGLKPTKKTKTGPSTDVEVLDELSVLHEVPRLMVEYRQLEKLKSTYVDVLPDLAEPSTGRVHTTFNQAVAATGRLSSSDPNLQNIPVRGVEGRRIRSAFVPRGPGRVLVSADYSQIELRVLAHVSGDPELRRAYTEGIDIHRLTASRVFGVDPADVTDEQRGRGKTINFGVIYGMGPQALSRSLKIPVGDAKRFIDGYFAAYGGVRAWLDGTLESARTIGYVETVSGRRRYLPDINSRNFNARAAAERVATNAPIQGTSADMIKLAMLRVSAELQSAEMDARMILQVHDELLFDCPDDELEALTALARREMEGALPLAVPVRVDVNAAANWGDC